MTPASHPLRLRVPPPHRPVLQKLGEVDDDTFEQLMAVLSQPTAQGASSIDELADELEQALPAFTPKEVALLLDAFISIFATARAHNRSAVSIAEVIAEPPNFDVEDSQRKKLVDRLKSALAAPLVTTTFKVSEVLQNYERILHDVQIMTDVRPVFGENVGYPEQAAVVNTIQISYHEERGTNSIHLVMDAEDLIKLRRLIDRALEKREALFDVLQKAGIVGIGHAKPNETSQ